MTQDDKPHIGAPILLGVLLLCLGMLGWLGNMMWSKEGFPHSKPLWEDSLISDYF